MEQGVCFIKLRDHIKLGGITSTLEGTIIIQKALKKTEKLSKSCSSYEWVQHAAVIQECSFAQIQDSKDLSVRDFTKQDLMAQFIAKWMYVNCGHSLK